MYLKFELISKLFNLAIAVAVVYEKYISCLGSFCPTTQGVGGGGCGATEISDFSRAAERRKKHYCPHPPSLPLLPSIVSEQCPRWYQLHLSTKWIRGQRQSAKSAISKALKKHTRLGIRERELYNLCIAIGQNSPNRVQMVSVGAKRVTWISRAWRKRRKSAQL